jgi:hypothetical protein
LKKALSTVATWQQARHIHFSKGNAHMRNLAERIYEMLGKIKIKVVLGASA